MSGAVHICMGGCVEDCPCEVRACPVDYDTDALGDGTGVLRAVGYPGEAEVIEQGHPCVHGSLGIRYPHPADNDDPTKLLHMAATADELHYWRDGDTTCVVEPYADEDADEPPITLELR